MSRPRARYPRGLWTKAAVLGLAAKPSKARGRGLKARESQVQAAVLAALVLHPAVSWAERTNTGGGRFKNKRGKERFVRFNPKGWGDITGMLRGGRHLSVECKAEGEEYTDDQRAHAARVNRGGGLAFIARSVEDVYANLPKPSAGFLR